MFIIVAKSYEGITQIGRIVYLRFYKFRLISGVCVWYQGFSKLNWQEYQLTECPISH